MLNPLLRSKIEKNLKAMKTMRADLEDSASFAMRMSRRCYKKDNIELSDKYYGLSLALISTARAQKGEINKLKEMLDDFEH